MIQRAVILSTGDELTTGRVVDTNSAAIAAELSALGIEVAAVLKVGDDREQLLWAFDQARSRGDLIIGTGGLGPTADDLTAETVAEFLARPLELNEAIAQTLKQRFAARHIPWTENNLRQARFPRGAVIIPNPVGTAPGFQIEVAPGKTLMWLPGVPSEMAAMLKETVIPWVTEQRGDLGKFLVATYKIYGLTESKLDELLKPLPLGPDAKLSFRAHYPDLSLRLTVRSGAERASLFDELRRRIGEILGEHIYAEGDLTLEEIVGRELLAKRMTLALAESCTGGAISHRITRIAGSSAYYLGGAVTYSNELKMRYLGVARETLEKHGAVSRETALEMSRGIRERTGASIGLSVTGVAGPSGGSPEKPVGTVWIGIAQGNRHEARLFRFHGERERIIAGTSQAALNWLRSTLKE